MVNYKDHSNLDIHNAEWFFTKPLPVVGSHDANVRIKTSAFSGQDESGRELHIDGNLVKFFQGHNLFGSHDIVGLVSAFMDHLCGIPQLGLCPTDFQRQSWRNGNFQLGRVDVTTMYQLRNRNDVLSWLATAEHTTTMTPRLTLKIGRAETKLRDATQVIHEGADKTHNVMATKQVMTLKELHQIAIYVQLAPAFILPTKRRGLDPNVSIMGSNNWQRLSKKPLCIVNV
ncbi:hypothetical protein KAM347_43500 [Aeromonas caviae]|nr:hypothetical protein KAM347_43500 [Aeromonas caviae]